MIPLPRFWSRSEAVKRLMRHCVRLLIPGMRSSIWNPVSYYTGYAMGNAEIIEQMTKVHQFCIMCAPTVSQYAAVDALTENEAQVRHMKAAYDERRGYLYRALAKLHMPCYYPRGAFYMFPDISRFGLSSETFALRLLQEEKVAVIPGTAFGRCGEGFVRISYACSIDRLKTATERMGKFVNGLVN